jgi:hypothetical protein
VQQRFTRVGKAGYWYAAARLWTVTLATSLVCLWAASGSARAWKPNTHLYAANQAIQPILAGANYITIHGKNYAVDPRVASAIRTYPKAYRAGVVGPDGFPDIYVGQSFIHPDTRAENGTKTGDDIQGDGHSFTYEWLRHVFEAGWAYYNANSGPQGQKVLAFTYGYLTHAAGDMWGHTFVNDFARGIFPSVTDVPNLPIAARHIVVEGYIGKHTPQTNRELEAPLDFVLQTLILGGGEHIAPSLDPTGINNHVPGPSYFGFVDSANQDPVTLGRGAIFDFFFGLRGGLEERKQAIDDLGINPLRLVLLPLRQYMDAWVVDIDNGIGAWPGLSQQISFSLFHDEDFGGALDAVSAFTTEYVGEMLGLPSFLTEFFEFLSSIIDPILEPLQEYIADLQEYLIEQATGIDLDELKQYVLNPETWINSSDVGLDQGSTGLNAATSAVLDNLMGVTQPGGTFDPNAFSAIKNTILTSQMILLTPASLNQLLHDKRVGPMYDASFPLSDRANVMLGFIRTLDGHDQWRRSTTKTFPNSALGSTLSEGMPIWNDCLARERVFRQLFTDWSNPNDPNPNFPDLGEPGLDLGATPPPASTLTLNGPSQTVGNTVYVSGTTTFRVAGAPDHFWNSDEISVSGKLTPASTFTEARGSLVLGPITGPDGAYTIEYFALGDCLSGPKHKEAKHTASFALDQTRPTITVNPPVEGQVLDVAGPTSTFVLDFEATDSGAGLNSQSATLDGKPILDGTTLDAFYLDANPALTPLHHEIQVTASDKVGNTDTLTRTFRVQATIPGLKLAIERAYQLQLVTIPPKSNPVYASLNAAEKSLNSGKIADAKSQLLAAKTKILAQSGRGADPAFATRFASWIDELVSRL